MLRRAGEWGSFECYNNHFTGRKKNTYEMEGHQDNIQPLDYDE